MADNREQTPPPTAEEVISEKKPPPSKEQVIAEIDAVTAAKLEKAEAEKAKKQADAEQPQEPSDTTPPPSKEQVIAEIDAVTAAKLEKAKTPKQADAPDQKTT